MYVEERLYVAAHHHIGKRTGPPTPVHPLLYPEMGRACIIIILICSFKRRMLGRFQNVDNCECDVPLYHPVDLQSGLGEVNIKS